MVTELIAVETDGIAPEEGASVMGLGAIRLPPPSDNFCHESTRLQFPDCACKNSPVSPASGAGICEIPEDRTFRFSYGRRNRKNRRGPQLGI